MKKTKKKISRRSKDLLIKILFKRASAEEVAACNPEELAFLSIYCRAEAHILWRLRQMFPRVGFSPESIQKLLKYLQARCLKNAAMNLKHDQVASEVCAHLVDNGIKVMLLKGTTLRERYPELAGRPQADTDFLVPPEDVERAERLMMELGFVVDEKVLTREQYLNEHFDLRMIRDGMPVEIHWTMSNECADGGIQRTWDRAKILNWRGVSLWLPSQEDEAVFTLVHICRHDFVLSFKWFGDLLVALEADFNFMNRFEAVARDWPSRMTAGPLSVAKDWGLPLEIEIGESLSKLGSLDKSVLGSLTGCSVFKDSWLGMPLHRLEMGLWDWICNEDGSLLVHLLRGLRYSGKPLVAAGQTLNV